MKDNRKLNLALILSILFHGAIVLLLMSSQSWLTKSKPDSLLEIEWVELQPKTVDTLKDRQIVEQEESINDKIPEKDYKLSLANQDVFKETKAQKNGDFQNKKNAKAGVNSKQAKSAARPQNSRQALLDKIKPTLFDDSFSPEKIAPAAAPARSGAEVSQNNEYLENIAIGAETLLKTREFVYYSYYNRIKLKLRQHWEPRIKEKIVKILRQGRTIASVNNNITRLVITLDKNGELVRIQVRNASGYNDLDDAAIEAFRAAAPFPNPPNGIVDGSGKVEINWDFVLETWFVLIS